MARLLIIEDNHALATLLATAARERQHEAVAVHTGQAAQRSLQEGGWDAAVVDLLLPDMKGTELLDVLRARGVPAVAMSGVYKGSRFAEEAMQQHGARAFFEKPFELDRLLDTVQGLLKEPAAEPPPQAADEASVELLLELSDVVAGEEEAGLPEAEVLLEADPEEAGAPESDWSRALPFAERERVWAASAGQPQRGQRAGRGLKSGGNLAEEPLFGLLNAVHESRFGGDLLLRKGAILKVLSFEKGRAVSAASNVAQERFARFCIRKGVLPEERLGEVARMVQTDGLRTGEAMIHLGLLTPERRSQLLEEQVKDILWNAFAWREGTYELVPRRALRPETVRLSLFLGDVILEGVLATEKLVTLREKLPRTRHLSPVAEPPYALHELRLSGPQAHLLAYADGTKTVEDLLSLTDLSEREALANLLGFQLLGLVEERRPPPRSGRISFGL